MLTPDDVLTPEEEADIEQAIARHKLKKATASAGVGERDWATRAACEYPGCEGVPYGGGPTATHCKKHYHLTPRPWSSTTRNEVRVEEERPLCAHEGCTNRLAPRYGKRDRATFTGMCHKHSQALRSKKPQRYCGIEGCEKKHASHDLCHMHLQRLRKNGTTDPPPVRGCDVDGCERTHFREGQCQKHYRLRLKEATQ